MRPSPRRTACRSSRWAVWSTASREAFAVAGSLTRQIERYLDHLSVERGLSANTLSAYRRDLRRYAAFLATWGIDDGGDADEDAVAAFVVDLSSSVHGEGGRPYKAASVARTL